MMTRPACCRRGHAVTRSAGRLVGGEISCWPREAAVVLVQLLLLLANELLCCTTEGLLLLIGLKLLLLLCLSELIAVVSDLLLVDWL
jgi:hypothetical protein